MDKLVREYQIPGVDDEYEMKKEMTRLRGLKYLS
jgi:hypothetical protein